MGIKVVLILLVVSLCSWTSWAQDQTLASAQETLMHSGVGIDLEESHIDDIKDSENLPKAYQKVLDSLLVEAETCKPNEKYRRADGVCNNLQNPLQGAVLHYQQRLLPNAYMDRRGIPRMVGKGEQYLASARTVSVKCFPPNEENSAYWDRETTQFSMQWGQYIDHDLIFTEVMPGSGCCDDPRHTCVHPDTFTGGPCFPIVIPPGDRYFNETCMIFKRSFSVNVNGVHEQISGVTSFIDASTVYGSSQAHQDALRANVGGLLKVAEKNMLPNHGGFKCRKKLVNADKCPYAGDPRVNVFPALTTVHLLFVREHNRLAKKLEELNPHWDDETIFQETRRIIAAIHQKITYEDFLPHVIGPDAMNFFGLRPGNFKYDPKVNPGILNEFGVAAFRYGHSQINSFLNAGGVQPISEIFFQPWKAQHSEGAIKKILRDQCKKSAQKTDKFMSLQVTDKLFLDVDAIGHSTDLAGRNIQRGRDHGIPPYLAYFDAALNNFIKAGNITCPPFTLPDCLGEKVYDSAEDIDLFVGGLNEQPMPGALVGPTFASIIGEQLRRLKYGDRFFYENDDPTVGFTQAQLREIRNMSVPHLLCRNFETKYIQPDIFHVPHSQRNQAVHCDSYKDIDLLPWIDTPSGNSKK